MAGLENLTRVELLAVATALVRVIEDLTAQVEALTAEVAELTRRLGQNSGAFVPLLADRSSKSKRDSRG